MAEAPTKLKENLPQQRSHAIIIESIDLTQNQLVAKRFRPLQLVIGQVFGNVGNIFAVGAQAPTSCRTPLNSLSIRLNYLRSCQCCVEYCNESQGFNIRNDIKSFTRSDTSDFVRGAALKSAGDMASNTLGRIGGRTGRLIVYIQCKLLRGDSARFRS